MKKYKEAKSVFSRALRVSEEIWKLENKNTVEILRDIGRVYEAEGNYEEAENYYKMALNRYKENRCINSVHVRSFNLSF